jgi:hypothetical protein
MQYTQCIFVPLSQVTCIGGGWPFSKLRCSRHILIYRLSSSMRAIFISIYSWIAIDCPQFTYKQNQMSNHVVSPLPQQAHNGYYNGWTSPFHNLLYWKHLWQPSTGNEGWWAALWTALYEGCSIAYTSSEGILWSSSQLLPLCWWVSSHIYQYFHQFWERDQRWTQGHSRSICQ